MIWYGHVVAEPSQESHALEIPDVKQVQRGRGALGDSLGFRHNSMDFRHTALLKRQKKKIPHQRFLQEAQPL